MKKALIALLLKHGIKLFEGTYYKRELRSLQNFKIIQILSLVNLDAHIKERMDMRKVG